MEMPGRTLRPEFFLPDGVMVAQTTLTRFV
jgi:hypothetical protein